jgi:hypothetical protein
MFYYLFHHIFHYWFADLFKHKTDGQKNVMTFLFGSIAWWLLASFLFAPHFESMVSANFISFGLRNFFIWLVLIDAISVAIIYKLYYNRSIICEVNEIILEEKNKKEQKQTEKSDLGDVQNQKIKLKE